MMFHYADQIDLHHFETVPKLAFSDFVSTGNKVDSDIQYDDEYLF
jgi:hypothetical protein